MRIDVFLHDGGDAVLSALHDLSHKLNHMEQHIMAKIDDFITAQTTFNASLDTALTDIGGDIQNLNDQIAALVAAGGTLTSEQQAALDALIASGTALQAKADALNALTPPVVPAP
jgi:hypothetical protein